MHQDLQGIGMTPILQLKCKCSTACHQTRTHHPALIKTDQAPWPHEPFQLPLLHMETSEWSKKRTMIMEEHPDVTKTIDFACSSNKDWSSHHKSSSGCSHGRGGRENHNGDHHQ